MAQARLHPGDVLDWKKKSSNSRRFVVVGVEGGYVWLRPDVPTCEEARRLSVKDARCMFRRIRKAVEHD